MKYADFLSFNLFQIKLFLTLAETLSFTRAAEICCVTQSAMSRNIKSLEDSLGIILFIRNTNKVVLTSAGRSLYLDWKDYYSHMEQAVYKAASLQEGITSQLQIGMSAVLNILPEVHGFLRTFQKQYPQVQLVITRTSEPDAVDLLRNHELDVLFQYVKPETHYDGIRVDCLTISPLVLFMLHSNPLSKKPYLEPGDLKTQNIIIHISNAIFNHAEFSREYLNHSHIFPQYTVIPHNISDLMYQLLGDQDICLCGRYHPERFNPMYAVRELGEARFPLCILTSSENAPGSLPRIFAEQLLHKASELF